ncbi:MAG: transposase [Planctomycetes bacterium]|nr:transposase [Planctomycetota bacterium]MBU2457014.1 transposase [Planctomycetota bacterium]
MTISNSRTTKNNLYSKGFQNGKTASYDQIANNIGKNSPENRSGGFVAILQSAKSARFHTSPGIYDIDTSSVFQDRLSRHNQNSTRASKYQRCSRSDQAASLYHSAKGSAEDAKKNIFQDLLATIFDYARDCRLIKTSGSHICSIDSTGLENHYISRHFLQRKGRRTAKYRKWTKLTAVCENQSYLIVSAIVSAGPSTDCHYLKPAVQQAAKHVSIDTLLADSGYDAEYNHQLCREEFGIRSTVIPVNDRNLRYGRTGGQHRRRMKQRFPAASYRKRWHIESVFSRFKRRLGNALAARTNESRTCECLLRVLTYNLMIVLFSFKKSVIY